MTLAHVVGTLAVLVAAGVAALIAFLPIAVAALAPHVVPLGVAAISAGPAYLALRKTRDAVVSSSDATTTALARLEGKLDAVDGKVEHLSDDVRVLFGWVAVHEHVHEVQRDEARKT